MFEERAVVYSLVRIDDSMKLWQILLSDYFLLQQLHFPPQTSLDKLKVEAELKCVPG